MDCQSGSTESVVTLGARLPIKTGRIHSSFKMHGDMFEGRSTGSLSKPISACPRRMGRSNGMLAVCICHEFITPLREPSSPVGLTKLAGLHRTGRARHQRACLLVPLGLCRLTSLPYIMRMLLLLYSFELRVPRQGAPMHLGQPFCELEAHSKHV